MHNLIFLLINFLSTTSNSKIENIKCVVVFHPSNCDYFITASKYDYQLLEWYGGNDPEKGDILVGDFNSYGFVEGYNLTQEQSIKVYVEDYLLSKSDALEKWEEKCN